MVALSRPGDSPELSRCPRGCRARTLVSRGHLHLRRPFLHARARGISRRARPVRSRPRVGTVPGGTRAPGDDPAPRHHGHPRPVRLHRGEAGARTTRSGTGSMRIAHAIERWPTMSDADLETVMVATTLAAAVMVNGEVPAAEVQSAAIAGLPNSSAT